MALRDLAVWPAPGDTVDDRCTCTAKKSEREAPSACRKLRRAGLPWTVLPVAPGTAVQAFGAGSSALISRPEVHVQDLASACGVAVSQHPQKSSSTRAVQASSGQA